MRKLIKALHFLGLAMFLGSVFGHISMGLIPGVNQHPQSLLFARQAITIATIYVTLPGLILLTVTGVALTLYGRLGVFKVRWLTLHQALGILILLNAVLILYPVGRELLVAADQLVQGGLSLEQFDAIAARERFFGPVNVLLALATLFIAVMKPGFRSGRARA